MSQIKHSTALKENRRKKVCCAIFNATAVINCVKLALNRN